MLMYALSEQATTEDKIWVSFKVRSDAFLVLASSIGLCITSGNCLYRHL
jgi:hypothetical protein